MSKICHASKRILKRVKKTGKKKEETGVPGYAAFLQDSGYMEQAGRHKV